MKDRIADLMLALLMVAANASFAQAPPASALPGTPGATPAIPATPTTSTTPAATPADAGPAPAAPRATPSPTASSPATAALGAATPATADVQRPTNAVLGAAPASTVRIGRVLLGSGQPGGGPGGDYENATQVYDNLFHAPQYLPFFPTAATIWPRAIEVPCRQSGADLVCDRYYWRPEYGRGEYLFFTPMVQGAAATGAAGAASPNK